MHKNIISQYADIFQLTKEIHTADAVQRFNIMDLTQRGRRWLGRCPLPDHNDSSPSFCVFSDGGWHCFGCGEHGDAVDLVARVYGLKPIEAARLIAQEFGIQVDKPLSLKEKRKAVERAGQIAREREAARAFEQKVYEAHKSVSLLVRTVNRVLANGGFEAYNNISEWVHRLPELEYIADSLLHRDIEIQAVALLQWRVNYAWAN